MKSLWYQAQQNYLMIGWENHRGYLFDTGDGERFTELHPSQWGWEYIGVL